MNDNDYQKVIVGNVFHEKTQHIHVCYLQEALIFSVVATRLKQQAISMFPISSVGSWLAESNKFPAQRRKTMFDYKTELGHTTDTQKTSQAILV